MNTTSAIATASTDTTTTNHITETELRDLLQAGLTIEQFEAVIPRLPCDLRQFHACLADLHGNTEAEATPATPMTPCPKPLQAGKKGTRSDPQDTAARLQNIGRLFARCRAIPAPKTADNWRHRRPPAVLTPTLPGWC